MSRSSAPPLRIALGTDRILPALGVGALLLLTAGALAHALWSSYPVYALGLAAFAAAAAWWTRLQRSARWHWLGCDAEGRWWLATRDGLRHEEYLRITVCPDTRVFSWLVVLLYRQPGARAAQALWLPAWRLEGDDLRRLRVRLRWGLEPPAKVPGFERVRAGVREWLGVLAGPARFEGPSRNVSREMPSVEYLLSDDPAQVYSEEELDAIEAIDPELALRLDRAQTFAQRQAADVRAEGPIDEQAVRQAVEEARRILMQDGGDIEYVGLEGRTVQVRLKGSCVGCPRSPLDLRHVVERLVRSRSPGVERVTNTF